MAEGEGEDPLKRFRQVVSDLRVYLEDLSDLGTGTGLNFEQIAALRDQVPALEHLRDEVQDMLRRHADLRETDISVEPEPPNYS